MIVLGVPLVLGLLWNKWAGGAAGFIMGGIMLQAQDFTKDITTASGVSVPQLLRRHEYAILPCLRCHHRLHGWSINNGSTNFKRMLGAGLTGSIIVAVLMSSSTTTVH